MALRDQPYLPLYVQDFLTDEKLMECSASATGIYIRVICIMHKSEPYGTILLKQKDKQTDNQIKNFALKLAKYLPYNIDEIVKGLTELINEGVLQNGGNKLLQKRMIKDNELNIIRAKAGKKGGLKTQLFAKAKSEANTENENENENENVIEDRNERINKREVKFKSEVFEFLDKYPEAMLNKFCNYWTEKNKSKTKMRFELEKTFEISKRLATWASRDKDIIKNNEIIPAYKTFTYEQMLEKLDKAGGITSFWDTYKKVKLKELPAAVWIHVNDIAKYNINV